MPEEILPPHESEIPLECEPPEAESEPPTPTIVI